jgi:GNAT superfamily N-acetyltransferase
MMSTHASRQLITEPLLRGEHLKRLGVGISGLRLEERIHAQLRESRVGDLYRRPRESFLASIAHRTTRCVVNPADLPADELRSLLLASEPLEERNGDIDLTDGLPEESYEAEWTGDTCNVGYTEGQALVVVAFADQEPVGYCGLSVMVGRSKPRNRVEAWFGVSLDMVYVMPRFRGQGRGLDLSIAAGLTVERIASVCCRALPERSKVTSSVSSECSTTRGEEILVHIAEDLQNILQITKIVRPDLQISDVDADAR